MLSNTKDVRRMFSGDQLEVWRADDIWGGIVYMSDVAAHGVWSFT